MSKQLNSSSSFAEYRCGQLMHPENGEVTVSGYIGGSRAEYSCQSQYTMKGSGLRICQILPTNEYQYSALWTGQQPECKG